VSRSYTRAGRMLIAGAFILMALMGACVLIFNRA